ncbi:MAG: glycoside hydrolase family 3 C-terminal domain-containing protein, partial [Clostridia bacterium]|nr:glycoside hydrolase family 3 C-terminal domain-containing protein [Clostridia bacterium]
MKKLFSLKLWRTITMVLSTLLVVFIIVNNVANAKVAALITVLGGETYKIVKAENASDEDTEYFKRDYTTQESLQKLMDDTCREVESEGIVLLKNDAVDNGKPALPMAAGSKVSLFLQGSVAFNYSSTGSSANTSTKAYPTLKDGLADYGVNDTLWNFYESGAASSYRRGNPGLIYKVREAPWSIYTQDVKNSFTSYGDAAVFVISRDSGEGMDISTTGSDGLDGSYLSITAEEKEVLKQITLLRRAGVFKRMIVLLNSAVQIQLDFMFDDDITVDACLWVGNVGSTGIYAIGDVMTGKVVPSGKLSDTYLKDNFSSPAMASWALNPNKNFTQAYSNAADYPQFGNTQNVYAVYVEGIYVGYRYYETRYSDMVAGVAKVGAYDYNKDVAYPFGHGLSYSDFYYSDFEVTENGDGYEVSVNVTNVGEYDAKEVVQVYLSKPYTEYDKANGVEKSAVELVGFKKVALRSGQDKTVKITVDKSQFKSYDAYGKGTYIIESGDYYLTVASDAHDAANNVLVSKGHTVDGKTAAKAAAFTYKKTLAVDGGVDATTYSTSAVNEDVKIQNRFDFADVNRYSGKGDNSVTYVTRSDWEGSFPKQAVSMKITSQMATDIASYKELKEDGSTMPAYGKSN